MRGQLAIQHVHIHWDKATRGMPGSGVRNALPREIPFDPPRDSERGWYQRIDYQARARFVPVTSYGELGVIEDWQLPLATRMEGKDHLWLRFNIANRAPHRPNLDHWIVRLPYGQRVTLRSNSKSDGDHDRWYFEDVVHVGWADTATLDLPVFREIDERALLY
ncbi:hypothetical protein [Sphingomonas sp.]|uniref:hypothetical protein n=1 Tax=Sphingomonas sp. TaxID=28214 RepID=UPI0017AA141B|nr:hypothetical protein [Sphingomonas sp.]MBA4762961.1 hypothetical protein [Sphingomonas sp.]